MSNTVRVIDNISGSTLFETTLEKIADAYSFAALMEKEGLDITIDAPGVTESLIVSLGANDQEIAEYKKSLDDETDSHNDDFGCGICLPKKL